MKEKFIEQHQNLIPSEINPHIYELSLRLHDGYIDGNDGPFIWTLIRDIHTNTKKNTIPSYCIQSENDLIKTQIARGCANFLSSCNWLQLNEDQQVKQLLDPVSTNGQRTYNIYTRMFSMMLQGKNPDEIIDMTRHRGHPLPSHIVIDIQQELLPYLPKQTKIQDEHLSDDDFPYIDLYSVPEEQIDNIKRKLLMALDGKFATYGGINLDVLFEIASTIQEYGITEKAEVCPEKDDILGLRMPSVWYFNTGGPPSPFALFFNLAQSQKYWKHTSKNIPFRNTYGIVALVEGYDTHQLASFAYSHGYKPFSTPFDLVNTAQFLVTGTALASVRDNPKFYQFTDHILLYWAERDDQNPDTILQTIRTIDPEEATIMTLELLRSYWQEVLVLRGVVTTDEEMIILDPACKSGEPCSLLFTRQPQFVLIGGNLDRFYPIDFQSNSVVEANLNIARIQYPVSTLITPRYISPDGASLWHANLTLEPGFLWTSDGILVSLIALRELGQLEDYRNIRSDYHALTKFMNNPRRVRRTL